MESFEGLLSLFHRLHDCLRGHGKAPQPGARGAKDCVCHSNLQHTAGARVLKMIQTEFQGVTVCRSGQRVEKGFLDQSIPCISDRAPEPDANRQLRLDDLHKEIGYFGEGGARFQKRYLLFGANVDRRRGGSFFLGHLEKHNRGNDSESTRYL